MKKTLAVLFCLFFINTTCAYRPYNNFGLLQRAIVNIETISENEDEENIFTKTKHGIGFIVNPQKRLLMTNCHVVETFFLETKVDIKVKLSDGKICRAISIDCNKEEDIAFLKIDCRCGGLPSLKIKKSEVSIGEKVFFVGSERIIEGKIEDAYFAGRIYLAVTTPFKQGDSGTPIIDSENNVVAIASAILVKNDSNEIFAFGAVPLAPLLK